MITVTDALTNANATLAQLTYRSVGSGELATHFLNLRESVTGLYEMDIAILDKMIPTLDGIALAAANEILASRKESLAKGIGNNSAYTCADVYEMIMPGVKVHKETGELYVSGTVTAKKVLEPGTFKKVNSSEKTLAKKAISKDLPSDSFRQFKIKNVDIARVYGGILEVKQAA
jgi:hypothetical protein